MQPFRITIQTLSRKTKKTLAQDTELQTKRTALLKAIQKFRNHQQAYMPGLIPRLNSQGFREGPEALAAPETMKLFLPSAFSPAHREKLCSQTIVDIELRLRKAQMSEALSGLRRQLCARMYVGKLKNKNGNGQAYYLRSNAFISQVNGRLREHQRLYDSARRAMTNLQPNGEWQEVYRELRPEDIRGINQKAEEARTLKRTREMAAGGRVSNAEHSRAEDKTNVDDNYVNEEDDDNDDNDELLDMPIQPLQDA
jgi:hypothetical protein